MNDFYHRIFSLSFNKGFNGVLEMLHYNNKLRFPKRFVFLQNPHFNNLLYGKRFPDHLFWDFWVFPKDFLNSRFFFFKGGSFVLEHFSESFFRRNYF